jgi:rhodanese-related sulfurtransferase
VDKGTAFIVDTRGPDAYAVEHIAGSVNIPETNIAARSGELPRDKMIVAYCS